MQSDNEHIYIEFHDKAREIYYNLYNSFEFSMLSLDRKTEEFKFGELKNRYIHSLKQQLENAAIVLLQKHQHYKQLNDLDQNFQEFIKHYLHLFLQKIKTV